MRNIKRIPIVLEKIDWELFVRQNTNKISETALAFLLEKIKNDLVNIKEYWLKYPDLRLGQLLINQGYLPDYFKLWNVEETKWLVDNNLCNFEDIHFWGKTRDKFGNKLPETIMILLKDLTDAHISAILDWCDDQSIKIDKNYRDYFEKRIENLKAIKIKK